MKNKKYILLCLLLLGSITLTVAQSNITKIEYYIDNDPGYNLGMPVSISPSTNIANVMIPINPSTLTSGIHTFNIRAMDANGNWSLQSSTLLYKPYALSGSSTNVPNLTYIEYYLDADPGYGQGTNVAFTAGTNVSGLVIPINPTSLPSGIHTITVRAKDADGGWSLVSGSLFYVPYALSGNSSAVPNIIALEYFIDIDPGYGAATAVTISNSTDIANVVIPINPATLTDGIHTFNVRAKDANGGWSLLNSTLIYKSYSSSGSLSTLPDITKLEYYIDTDPGYGLATDVSISQGTNLSDLVIPIDPASLNTGIHRFSIRAMDADGRWSLVNDVEFNIMAPAISSTPVALTGFNADVIAEVANDALGSTTAGFDLGYAVLMAQSYNPSGPSYLPNNGVINSFFRPGLQYQLQPYTANNSLRLYYPSTDSLTFINPVSAEDVYILAAAGNGSNSVNITIRYSDQSTEMFPNQVIADWFGGSNDYAIRGIGRTYRYYNTIENYEKEPRLYTIKLTQAPVNHSKPIQSISFTSSGYSLNILAVSVGNLCNGIPNPGNTLASSSAVCPNTPFTLSLQNGFLGSGVSYQWQRANNLAFTQGVVNLGTSYSQQTSQTTTRYYRCQVSCSSGGTTYSTPIGVTMNTIPTITLNASPTSICYGASTTLTASGGLSFSWSHTPATNSILTTSPIFSTTYTVTGTDANGCTNTATTSVVVHSNPSVSAQNAVGCSSSPLTLVGFPSGGVFSVANPYTGPSTTFTYTYTNANGCSATSTVASISTYSSLTYYLDNDQDGYGDANTTQASCAQPAGYVLNNSDCNDADSSEHPNQKWYIDHDGDHYGTGYYVIQCTRPTQGYTISQLISATGDCDDTNPTINPGAQYFTFSTSADFTSSLVFPLNGNAYTNFTFEAIYFDANGGLPPATFPRAVLDYEGNNSYTDINDRSIIMTPSDASDLNTMDGKKYTATITSLVVGTNYQTSIQTTTNGCTTVIGPFNYPDVLQQPDIEIFANDITFSIPHPPISSPFTVNATLHNESDFAAQNFVVHLRNQYDTTLVFPDITVAYVPPHGSYTVSWNFITPSIPAWCPMEVTIDYTNVIAETNELDNQAIRPFINGNYNLPGGIAVTSTVNPTVGYSGSYTYMYGEAHYFGTAIPLVDSSVAGATVSFTIMETGATFSTYTNSSGNFYYGFPNPVAPGIYHIQGTVTDFTLTGNLADTFEVIIMASGCTLPDLGVQIQASNPYSQTITTNQTISIVEGDHLTGTITVPNSGLSIAGSSVLNISNSGSSPSLGSSNVPSLSVGASYNKSFNIIYNTAGYYSLFATADATSIISECSEGNTQGIGIRVLPAMPDISPYTGPGGTTYDCQISSVGFTLANYGGLATGSFDCTVLEKLNGIVIGTYTHTVPNIPSAVWYGTNYYSFNMPFTPSVPGDYSFEIQCDLPTDAVAEYMETNNIASYSLTILQCKPNLAWQGCESFNVASADGDYASGSNVSLEGVLVNNGNLTYTGNVNLRYQLSGGSIYNDNVNVNLLPGASIPVSKVITAPPPATEVLTITADPTNLIDELSEADNSITDNMCWDFYLDSNYACGYYNYFWNHSFLVNQAAYLSVGVISSHLYDADTLHVKFEVSGPGLSGTINLGDAVLYDVKYTCYCPIQAYLPTSFVFPQIGTYTFKMTVDPDHKYTECNEANNVLIRTVQVVNLPDMRILSQHIAPSLLNPQPGQSVSLNITYENIGYPNSADHMKLKVLVDNTVLSTVNNVSGLVTGDNITVAIPNTWSSNVVGIHIIRAIIDADNTITELNEMNNEATRAIVVGQSANMHFKVFKTLTPYPALNSTMNVRARVGNNGDLPCESDMQLFYVNNNNDTILFNTTHVNLNAHDSVNFIIPWTVVDNKTTIVGKIINSSVLEYTYDDNYAEFELGKMYVLTNSLPACINSMGSISANPISGEPPYSYLWNTGYTGQMLSGPIGTYTVTVTDNTGKTASATNSIVVCPPVTVNLQFYLQGYYLGNGYMTPTLSNEGWLNPITDVDSVTIELHDTLSPFVVVASFTGILHTNGNMECYFPSNVNGSRYYIVVKHRSSIETWSAEPVLISTSCSYIFSSHVTKAYGNNMMEVESNVWAFYSGDINQDGAIDAFDYILLDPDIIFGNSGYLTTDLNGDGSVDAFDYLILDPNLIIGIGVIAP